MNYIINVLYFGPITAGGKASKGGYAAANRKICDCLKKKGCEVSEFGKRNNFQLFVQPFRLFIVKRRKKSVIHISTPLGGLFMVPVLMIELIAKIRGIPVLLDIRAGFFIRRYIGYNTVYKCLTQSILKLADLVCVEGKCYVEQIKTVLGYKKDICYFPNVVDCSDLQYEDKAIDRINIFYFGRITGTKGIGIMLEVIKRLDNRYRLYLAGSIASDINRDELETERVTYLGMLKPLQLKNEMRKMHIFLFPTHHIGEGQSNSLIEAMSQGLIPITADNGFCREVVSDCGLVLPFDAGYEEYVNAVKFFTADKLNDYGRRCVDYIKSRHNIDTEVQKIITKYEKIY